MITHINKFFNSPLGMILLTLITFITAFFINSFEEKLGTTNLIIGSLFTISIIVISIIIYANFSRLEIQEAYEENNEVLKAFIKGQGLGDIVSEHELSRIESNAKSIWVFTLDLSNDIGIEKNNVQTNEIFETVKNNLENGIEYTYFIPDEPLKYGAIEKFKKLHNFKKNQVRFCFIPVKEFHIVSEIVIYDNEQAMQWFPSNEMNYYIRLDKNYTMNIVGSGQLLLDKYLK